MAQSSRRNVTFELTKEHFDALGQDARDCQAESRHQRAREIVTEYLSQGHVDGPQEAIERLDSEVAYLQELVRRLAYIHIVLAGRDSEEANSWIREHMPSRPT